MNAILITLIVCGLSLQHITKKAFNEKMNNSGAITFTALSTLAAMLFFVFQIKPDFDLAVLPYALGFGFFYGMAVLCSFFAIANGSLSITSLVTSYSLVIPTFYGILFGDDKFSVSLIVGLVLLMVSLFLINFVKRDDENNKITVKWIVFLVLAFVGNGLCTTVQNIQQKVFNGAYKAQFMSIALFFVVVVLLLIAIFKERKCMLSVIKKGSSEFLICGIANGLCNFLVMVMVLRMPASIMYPLISACSIILTYFISKFWFKEKLTLTQNIGFIFGVVSVVFLNM